MEYGDDFRLRESNYSIGKLLAAEIDEFIAKKTNGKKIDQGCLPLFSMNGH